MYKPNLVIVHYDENKSKVKPHGNRVHNTRPNKRTATSVMKEIKTNVVHKHPAPVYRQMTCKGVDGVDQPVMIARDLKQVQNAKERLSRAGKLSRDELYNLVLLSYNINDLVWLITVYPDLLCVVALKDTLSECEKLLKMKDEPVTFFMIPHSILITSMFQF